MRVLLLTPNKTDPLAFYRASLPFTRMREDNSDFHFTCTGDFDWSVGIDHDLIYLHRPVEDSHMAICNIADRWNLPIIADFDDWFLDLDHSNPAKQFFDSRKDNFLRIINSKSVRGIMVSTNKLKELILGVLQDKSKPIWVIPNAYDAKGFSYYRNEKNLIERNKYVVWRGGNSHTADLLSVKLDFEKLFSDFPDWDFLFIAQYPWMFKTTGTNVKFIEPLGIAEFHRALHDLAPAIMTHPLSDSDFNRSKSMCAWIEATHARAAFVGPDFEEFNRNGIINYGKDKSFYEAIAGLISEPIKIRDAIFESDKTIQTELTLSKINRMRLDCFKSIIKQ